MKLLVAVICCDYKAYSLEQCINAIKESDIENYQLLLNFEMGWDNPNAFNSNLFLHKLDHFHVWKEYKHWAVNREKDQDQHFRLPKICTARNMCVDFAIANDFDWILFVDSDVLIPKDTYTRLFDENWLGLNKVIGGMVPGRGVHSTFDYAFEPTGAVLKGANEWVEYDHGTMGFVAIENTVFKDLRFRWTKDKSEDKCFSDDVSLLFEDGWWINTKCIAAHMDHPERPLDFNNVANY